MQIVPLYVEHPTDILTRFSSRVDSRPEVLCELNLKINKRQYQVQQAPWNVLHHENFSDVKPVRGRI